MSITAVVVAARCPKLSMTCHALSNCWPGRDHPGITYMTMSPTMRSNLGSRSSSDFDANAWQLFFKSISFWCRTVSLQDGELRRLLLGATTPHAGKMRPETTESVAHTRTFALLESGDGIKHTIRLFLCRKSCEIETMDCFGAVVYV